MIKCYPPTTTFHVSWKSC